MYRRMSEREYRSQLKDALRQVRNICKEMLRRTTEAAPVFAKRSGDNRPYIGVSILGLTVDALVDSGANNSIVGSQGIFVLDKLGLRVRGSSLRYVVTADGRRQKVKGVVDLPVCVGREYYHSRSGTVRELSVPIGE